MPAVGDTDAERSEAMRTHLGRVGVVFEETIQSARTSRCAARGDAVRVERAAEAALQIED
ncbi:hypothetical protein Q0F99_00190 [Rathayibacter oskolensis]|uniref:hypothetical protein n=1 Tax=Rathayibacter TaxID=33886 RepID=UPI001318F889|nr:MULTISPECIES: hypothetical protein [Rathayibacter]QHC67092.1 hypothetical protein GSU68_11310 [Rathayibacter sp. VKM Ac-2759]WKK71690.1 hypothetical protein Q0F99_00190 [Rathayibacter oskolensis]